MWLYVPDAWMTGNGEYTDAINILDACAGSGMFSFVLEEAFRSVGLRAQTLVHVERDASAAAALVGLAQAAGREAAVWDDLSTFDGVPWRGIVDCVCAGLPCPAFSCAGRKTGNADHRAWGAAFDPRRRRTWGPQPHLLRILAEVRPRLVVCENVSAWVSGGHFALWGECLSRLGYTIADPLFFAAEDVGAPHRRERVFVLAQLADTADAVGRSASGGGRSGLASDADGAGMADGRCERLEGRRTAREETDERNAPDRRRQVVGDALGDARSGREPEPEHSQCPVARNDKGDDTCGAGLRLHIYPPGRNDYRSWAAVANMAPSRMPSIESGVSVVADGMAFANADLLRIGGNGVDSMAAAVACRVLLDRAGIGA